MTESGGQRSPDRPAASQTPGAASYWPVGAAPVLVNRTNMGRIAGAAAQLKLSHESSVKIGNSMENQNRARWYSMGGTRAEC